MRPYKVESRTLLFKTKEGVLLMETEKNGQKGKTDTEKGKGHGNLQRTRLQKDQQ